MWIYKQLLPQNMHDLLLHLPLSQPLVEYDGLRHRYPLNAPRAIDLDLFIPPKKYMRFRERRWIENRFKIRKPWKTKVEKGIKYREGSKKPLTQPEAYKPHRKPSQRTDVQYISIIDKVKSECMAAATRFQAVEITHLSQSLFGTLAFFQKPNETQKN